MRSVIVAHSNPQAAQKIRAVLSANGVAVSGVCSSAAQTLARAAEQEGGVVVSGYRLPDMAAVTMASMLPPAYEVLLLLTASQAGIRATTPLPSVLLPVNREELVGQVRKMLDAPRRRPPERKGREDRRPAEKSEESRTLIAQAKEFIMQRDHLSEAQAHRYLQKRSMDSGKRTEDTAREILAQVASAEPR